MDQPNDSRCDMRKVWKKGNLSTDFQSQLISVFNEARRLRIVNLRPKHQGPLLPAQFAVTAVLRDFDQCQPTMKGRKHEARVVIEVHVKNTTTGATAFSYVSSVSALGPPLRLKVLPKGAGMSNRRFRSSTLGQATRAALVDLASRVELALLSQERDVQTAENEGREHQNHNDKLELKLQLVSEQQKSQRDRERR